MNKRILKLFNEAGFHQPEMERLGIENKFEKFAELIVQECIKTLEFHGFDDAIPYVKWMVNHKLGQHFGVEE